MANSPSHGAVPVLLAQTSSAQEKFSSNGVQKVVHNVIKNHPFTLRVGLNSDSTLNFNQLTPEAHLVYDAEGPEKEVDFVKSKPLEYFTHTNDKGDQLFVQIRIKVLSSQHEDMFFRVKVINFLNSTKELIPNMTIYSQPIKVISKPDQIKKRNGAAYGDVKSRSKRSRAETTQNSVPLIQPQVQAQTQVQTQVQTQLQTQVQPQIQTQVQPQIQIQVQSQIHNQVQPQIQAQVQSTFYPTQNLNSGVSIRETVQNQGLSSNNRPGTTERNQTQQTINSDQLVYFIKRIEKNMQMQSQQLERACQKIENLERSHGLNQDASMENAFENMMRVYNSLEPMQRTEKIRKLTKCSSVRDAERLSEFLQALWVEGIEVIEHPGIPETPPYESSDSIGSPSLEEHSFPTEGFGCSNIPLNSSFSGNLNFSTNKLSKSLKSSQGDFMGFLISKFNRPDDPFIELAE